MAQSPKAGSAPQNGEAPKRKSPPRPAGPTKMYLVIAQGADVNLVKQGIEKATTNRSELLDMLTGETPRSVITLTVQRGQRGGKETVAVSTDPGAAG